jgi:transmembrane sensor
MENYQQNNIPYHLILDEMERDLSTDEVEELEQWKTASPENLAAYNALRQADDRIALLHLYQTTDVDDAWNKISGMVDEQEPVPVKHTGRLKLMLGGLAAAVIIGVSVLLFNWFSPAGEMIYQTASEQRQIALPDGSQVFLNKNSVISYKKRNFLTNRHVKLLQGEAYFDVIHEDKNEFLVELGDVVVRDLGTSFDCTMDPGNIQVVVNSGTVSMEYRQTAKPQKVILVANQMAIFNRSIKQLIYSTAIPPNYKAWQDKKLRYVQTPLSHVFRDLNRIYGTQVVFQDTTLKERRLSAYFNQKTEEQIMHIIATSLQIKVVKKDSTFILSQ